MLAGAKRNPCTEQKAQRQGTIRSGNVPRDAAVTLGEGEAPVTAALGIAGDPY